MTKYCLWFFSFTYLSAFSFPYFILLFIILYVWFYYVVLFCWTVTSWWSYFSTQLSRVWYGLSSTCDICEYDSVCFSDCSWKYFWPVLHPLVYKICFHFFQKIKIFISYFFFNVTFLDIRIIHYLRSWISWHWIWTLVLLKLSALFVNFSLSIVIKLSLKSKSG